MTLAAVDRLVHHATIFEMNVESYRRRAALQRQTGAGRTPKYATIKSIEKMSISDNKSEESHLTATIYTRTLNPPRKTVSILIVPTLSPNPSPHNYIKET